MVYRCICMSKKEAKKPKIRHKKKGNEKKMCVVFVFFFLTVLWDVLQRYMVWFWVCKKCERNTERKEGGKSHKMTNGSAKCVCYRLTQIIWKQNNQNVTKKRTVKKKNKIKK